MREPIDFDSYSDMEVFYLGVPYPKSKLVDGYGILESLTENTVPFLSNRKCDIVRDEKQCHRARVQVEVSKANSAEPCAKR
jgi:hypothetical protein